MRMKTLIEATNEKQKNGLMQRKKEESRLKQANKKKGDGRGKRSKKIE